MVDSPGREWLLCWSIMVSHQVSIHTDLVPGSFIISSMRVWFFSGRLSNFETLVQFTAFNERGKL